MADTQQHEEELKRRCAEQEKTATDPAELLRLKCLKRGASGIKGLGRLVFSLHDFQVRPILVIDIEQRKNCTII